MSLFSKKDEEPKIDISKLREYLIKASEAGFLDWEPTGNWAEIDGKTYWGHKTKLPNGSLIEIVIRSIEDEMVLGLVIKEDTEELFLTDNPKKLPGKEVTEPTDLLVITSRINAILENKDLINSIESELASLIYS
jgi:hypothetical protein